MTFLVYHYASASNQVFNELQTLNYRNKEVGNFPSYRDHLSFMFERPDFEKIAALYLKRGHTHPFWYKGHELYEYVVDLDNVRPRKRMWYSIVESPEKTELYYDKSVDDTKYDILLKKAVEENGYEGDNIADLKKAWTKLRSRLKSEWMDDAYKKLMSAPNFDVNKNKYAPTVPHLMLYLEEGKLAYKDHSRIVIGGGKTIAKESVKDSLAIATNKRIYDRW